MNIHQTRLTNVAKALREAPRPDDFNMGSYGGWCGTPHCALGHYAARGDLQKTFSLGLIKRGLKAQGQYIGWGSPHVLAHFGISRDESKELFSYLGCRFAETPEQAAAYIEAFIARKWPNEITRPTLEPAYSKLRESLQA